MITFNNIKTLLQDVAESKYILVNIGKRDVSLLPYALHRYEQVAEYMDCAMVYSHYVDIDSDGNKISHPCIEYQEGSIRDDFDFGPVVLLNVEAVRQLACDIDFTAMPDGGWYALRLALSQWKGGIKLCREYLYEAKMTDFRASGQKQHDYVNPRARGYQECMEKVATGYLKRLNALSPICKRVLEHVNPEQGQPLASIVIPVRNRVRTIADAIDSALHQECDFTFNVLVVDNGSTDGTVAILNNVKDERLKCIFLKGDEGLGIGGCWNKALLSPDCGIFAVQLDSDDVYGDTDALQKIIDKFREGGYAAVVGSYTLTDEHLNVLPPGLIDHSEWTSDNGANNALRINGFGAPRAFYVPLAKQILFPNTSYGEDYAMMLAISREYEIGRIYESLYNCRRWSGNSDAALSVEQTNAHNLYKDSLRSMEIDIRKQLNG